MWQQSVENRLTDLGTRMEGLRGDVQTNFRWTWAGMAGMFVLLAGLFIQGYLILDGRVVTINERVLAIQTSINQLLEVVAPKGE